MNRIAIVALAAVLTCAPSAAAAPELISPVPGEALTSAAAARPTFEWALPEAEQACQVVVARGARSYDEDGVLEYNEFSGDRKTHVSGFATSWRPKLPLPAGSWFWQVSGWDQATSSADGANGDQAYCELDAQRPSVTHRLVVPYVLRGLTYNSYLHVGEQAVYMTPKFWTTADNATVTVSMTHGRTVLFRETQSGSKPWGWTSKRFQWDLYNIPCDQKFDTKVVVRAGPRVERIVGRGGYFTCQ